MNLGSPMVSLETLIAASPMLGHKLEDRSSVRQGQDADLVGTFQRASTIALRDASQKNLFLVAPLDILVVDAGGRKRFHIIETNGTGIGGLTNVPDEIIETVLGNLSDYAASISEDSPLVLVAVSGMESSKHPRHNHLLHEKLLYVDAVKRGLERRRARVTVHAMSQLGEHPQTLQTNGPAVVLGYIKEFLNVLECNSEGRLTLLGRPVTAAVNDRFCLNVVTRFGHLVDLNSFGTLNRCFATGGDKGLAYGMLQEFASAHRNPHFPEHISFGRADHRAALIRGVVDRLRRNHRVVIKPQGTGLGHGLEFFLKADEPIDSVISKIDHSIRVTEHYYGAVGGAFPYALCEFLDACTIAKTGHELAGHKYEVRVVVYRDGMNLKAVPSIAKISSQGYDTDKATRLSLINNITTSAEANKCLGTEFMLPLNNQETLDILEITPEQLESVCQYCAGFMSHIVNRVQDRPGYFLLPH